MGHGILPGRSAPAGGLVLALAFACATAGDLRVRVSEASGEAPLEGVAVVLSRGNGDPVRRLTDARGIALFSALPAGDDYGIEATLEGFAGVRLADVAVPAEGTAEQTLRLARGVRETVTVSGRRSPVVLDETTSSTRFSDEFIESLPVQSRFLQNTLTLAPGVLDADEDGNPNVHGGRSGEFRVLVNGVANTDPLTGEYLSFVSLESVEEIEIVTAGAGVEFGRAQGGFARVLQKQGADELEATLGLIWRSDDLDGNGASSARRPPEFEWFQPFVQVSGPIRKGRAWYRLTQEYVDREDPINAFGSLLVTRRRQTISSNQITWQASSRNKLSLAFLYDPLRLENVDIGPALGADSSRTVERGGPTYTLGWVGQHSPRLLVESLVAYQNHRLETVPTTPGVDNDCVFSTRFLRLEEGQCTRIENNVTSGSFYVDSRDRRRRLTVRSDATYYPTLLPSLSPRIKFGVIVENERYFRELVRGIDFSWTTATVPITIFNPTGRIGFASALFGVPREATARNSGTSWGVYVEGQLRPRSNLVLTGGLRFDRESIDSKGFEPFDPEEEARQFLALVDAGLPVFEAMRQSFTAYEGLVSARLDAAEALGTSPSRISLTPISSASTQWLHARRPASIDVRDTNVSPRLTLAWDPTSDGKTKLAVSLGRYHDKIPLAVPLVEAEPPIASASFTGFPASRRPRDVQSPWQEAGASVVVDPTAIVRVVDRDLRTPYQDELAISFERELWNETQLKLSWLQREFRDQLQDVDVNHAPGDFGRCLLQRFSSQPVIEASPGSGQVLVDPFTGESYEDTDPGDGDGRLDDCRGGVAAAGSFGINEPDGLLDLYTRNPAWGDLLVLGNFNRTDYEAFVLEIVRRFHRGWQLNGSYTWSEAIGDAESFDQDLGNDQALRLDESGFLAYDQRHVVKLSAATVTPRGIRLGGTFRWESGLPYSVLRTGINRRAVPPAYGSTGGDSVEQRLFYPSGQRNDRRSPSFWTFDVRVARDVGLGGGKVLSLAVEIFNLLNDDSPRVIEQVNGEVEAVGRFGRRFQLGARLSF